jgi:hypothetical protein
MTHLISPYNGKIVFVRQIVSVDFSIGNVGEKMSICVKLRIRNQSKAREPIANRHEDSHKCRKVVLGLLAVSARSALREVRSSSTLQVLYQVRVLNVPPR